VTTVIVEPEKSFENALRRFTKQCEKSPLMPELSKRLHDEKPSVKRKTLAARKKVQKRQRMSE
jgi:small subunit ribosomal protein S21